MTSALAKLLSVFTTVITVNHYPSGAAVMRQLVIQDVL